jgi:hypothetical protein
MARQLTETDNQLNASSIGSGNTTISVARPSLSVDDGGGFKGSELVQQIRNGQANSVTEIKVNGKYSEVNYVTFNIPNLNSVEGVSGNVFTGVRKVEFPPESLPPTDTSTSGTSGTQGPTYPPFGEPGYVGEIRQSPNLNDVYFIWTFNYNVGRWAPYIPDSGTFGVGGSGNQNPGGGTNGTILRPGV